MGAGKLCNTRMDLGGGGGEAIPWGLPGHKVTPGRGRSLGRVEEVERL